MISRKPQSHKGQNGKVAIIGGSQDYHGAPLFSALAAEYSGADLIYPVVPKCHIEVTKNTSLNFICVPFQENILTEKDIKTVLALLDNCNAVVIGPGIGNDNETLIALEKIIPEINIPTILDASAVQMLTILIEKELKTPDELLITPHHGEFAPLTKVDNQASTENSITKVHEWAERLKTTILLKGPTDIIVTPQGKSSINQTGNAGLTVGGTGDALAGLIGGLVAQGMSIFEAAEMSAKVIGMCGEELYGEKEYCYRTIEVIEKIPYVMKKLKTQSANDQGRKTTD